MCLELGTGHFLPAVSTQGEKEEGKRNANECWQSLYGLSLCSFFWLSDQKILQNPGASECSEFPRESRSGKFTFLYFLTNRNLHRYLYRLLPQKREECRNSLCLILNPRLCSRQLLPLQNYSYRAIHFLLPASFFFKFYFMQAAMRCKGRMKGYLWGVSGCL